MLYFVMWKEGDKWFDCQYSSLGEANANAHFLESYGNDVTVEIVHAPKP